MCTWIHGWQRVVGDSVHCNFAFRVPIRCSKELHCLDGVIHWRWSQPALHRCEVVTRVWNPIRSPLATMTCMASWRRRTGSQIAYETAANHQAIQRKSMKSHSLQKLRKTMSITSFALSGARGGVTDLPRRTAISGLHPRQHCLPAGSAPHSCFDQLFDGHIMYVLYLHVTSFCVTIHI